MRVRKTEIMQVVAARIGENSKRIPAALAAYGRAGRGFLADLQDGWPQTRVCRLIVREVYPEWPSPSGFRYSE